MSTLLPEVAIVDQSLFKHSQGAPDILSLANFFLFQRIH
jgi:hypothetical protein